MDFSITNVGKAKNELKKLGITNFNKENVRNCSFEFGEKDGGEIIENGYSSRLNTLVEAGKYLKKSLWTRSTSNKDNDFSILQSGSSRNEQELYRDIQQNRPDTVFTNRTVKLSKENERKIKKYEDALNASLHKIQKIINTNKEIGDYVRKQLKDNAVTQSTLNKLNGLVPDNVQFIKDNSISAAKNFLPEQLKTTCIDAAELGCGGAAGAAMASSANFAMLLSASSISIPCLVFGAQVTATMVPACLALPLAVAAGLLIAALVVYCDKDRFGTIILKRRVIKINDEFTKALKCLNGASKVVRQATRKPEDKIDATLNDAQKKILRDFFEKQKKLWTPYTTAAGKGYHRSEEDEKKGVHRVGLIKVKDETINNRSIQILKLMVATLWANAQLNI